MGVILDVARHPSTLRRLALGSVVANVVIVVTGGAVRLTSSGLGCPTWPSCTTDSLTPTPQYAGHGIIEFTNRQLTFVLGLVAVLTLLSALLARRERTLAAIAFAGIPGQVVLGGLTVLTHLNPWLVAAHFLFSMAILAVTMRLWWKLRPPGPPTEPTAPAAVVLGRLLVAGTAAVLALGTVVTGSGPHAGDQGAVHRTGLDPAGMSQLHADAVMLLIGATVGVVLLLRAVRADGTVRRAATVLLGVELAQGLIGFAQYFSHLPVILVGLHMLGACLVWLTAWSLLLRLDPPRRPPPAAATVTTSAPPRAAERV